MHGSNLHENVKVAFKIKALCKDSVRVENQDSKTLQNYYKNSKIKEIKQYRTKTKSKIKKQISKTKYLSNKQQKQI